MGSIGICLLSETDARYVTNCDCVSLSDTVLPVIGSGSYGANVLDHLAADGAGFAAGQVAVVALLEVDAHLVGGLHLELVHGLTGLGDVQTVAGGVAAGVAGVIAGVVGIVVAHGRSLLFLFGKRSLPEGCEVLSVGVFCPGHGVI